LLHRVSRPNTDLGSQADLIRLKLNRDSDFDIGHVKSQLEIPDSRALRENPYLSRDWKSEHSLRVPLPVSESIFVYGDYQSGGDTFVNQQVKIKGRTGVGVKFTPFSGSELQFRTGQLINYADLYAVRPQEKSQLSLELQAKLDLFGPFQLQYSGEALPAFSPAERHALQQDLKIALPLGTNREIHIGAKYRWEELSTTPWMDRAQLYLGIKFQR
jgi:hypothetical protein